MLGSHENILKGIESLNFEVLEGQKIFLKKKKSNILKPGTLCGNLGVLHWTKMGETCYTQKSA